jgi:hypothetical protein
VISWFRARRLKSLKSQKGGRFDHVVAHIACARQALGEVKDHSGAKNISNDWPIFQLFAGGSLDDPLFRPMPEQA